MIDTLKIVFAVLYFPSGLALALINTKVNNDHCPTAAAGCILLPLLALPFVLLEYTLHRGRNVYR
jgi:hypothetical protein